MSSSVHPNSIVTNSTGTTTATNLEGYNSKTKGKRQLKTQGTCKLGERCIAHMKATIDQLTGTVEVQYCSTHHNHDHESRAHKNATRNSNENSSTTAAGSDHRKDHG